MTTTASRAGTRHFHLPDVGEGLTEAEVVTWHVAVGDVVEESQVLVDIETAKSVVELPSPYAGVVRELLVAEGDTVEVGTAIVAIGAGVDDDPEALADADDNEDDEDGEPGLLVGYGARPDTASRRRRRSGAPAAPVAPAAPREEPPQTEQTDRAAPAAKPPVRALARDLGVDLRGVVATGPHGTTTRDDVRAAADRADAGDHAPPTADDALDDRGRDEVAERIPVKGVRKHTAAAMVSSAFTAPHASVDTTVDVTAGLALLERARTRRELADVRLGPLLLVARAYLRALTRTPLANARWDEAAGEIVVPRHVALGIATATPRGLVVPHVPAADRLDVAALARAIGELVATAREGRTPPEAMTGGTTTLTNVGVFGIDGGTPILNPGETTILAVGAVRRRPWVVTDPTGGADERVEVRSVVRLTLSFDHRVLDGQEAAAVLADTAAVLEDPGLALL